MNSNKAAYDLAFQRAADGKGRSVLEMAMSLFEDEYTRQSRLKGERDGAATLAGAGTETTEAATS